MKKIKENAATMLLALFCAVFMLPVIITGCTNSEDGFLVTRPLPPVEIRDTTYIWKDTTIYIDRVEIQGLKANGEAELDKVDDTKYRTDYPVIEDGQDNLLSTYLKVWAKVGDPKDIVVISSRNIGLPSVSTGARTVKQYIDGAYNKASFDAEWLYTWESANNFTQSVYTMHEMAWYKKFLQMLSSSWNVNFERIGLQTVGKEYVHNGAEGTLYTDTLIWAASYYKEDVRKLKQTQDFFLPSDIVEPTPGKEIESLVEKYYDNDSTYVITRLYKDGTYSDTTVINIYGYEHELIMPTLERIMRDNTNFGRPTITPKGDASRISEETKKGNLLFSKLSQKVNAAYTGHDHDLDTRYTGLRYTEQGKFCELSVKKYNITHNQNALGTLRIEIENGRNYEVTPISFKYNVTFGKEANVRNTDTEVWNDKSGIPTPDKILERLVEKSYDNDKTYVITRFYTDGTYSDTTVINTNSYPHKIVMPTLEKKLNRDNTDFGTPTIAKKGSATKIGNSSQKEGLIFQGMSQNMNSAYTGHTHVIELQYTALQYTEQGKSCDLSVPMWNLSHNQNALGTLRQEVENNKNFDVTPVSFRYNAAFGNAASSIQNTDTEVWIDKGQVNTEIGQIGRNLGFDYVNETTSYAFATFYSIMSDGTEKLLGDDGVNVFNSVQLPAGQVIDVTDFNVENAQAIPGTKQFVSQREATGKFGGKFLVKKYRTIYTTKTNKANVVFSLYHEEAEYVPTKGAGFPMIFKVHEVTDLGMSPLTSLDRINGKDGMRYDSQISAAFNGRTGSVLKSEVQLWMKSDNKNGIDLGWTASNGGMTHYWDYTNVKKVSTIVIYNNSDGTGGIKGYSNGVEVVKATWDEVEKPTGRVGIAELGGRYYICQMYETADKKALNWRSIMKDSPNKGITSIEKRQAQISDNQTDTYIATTVVENADQTVTLTSKEGTVTAAAW